MPAPAGADVVLLPVDEGSGPPGPPAPMGPAELSLAMEPARPGHTSAVHGRVMDRVVWPKEPEGSFHL